MTSVIDATIFFSAFASNWLEWASFFITTMRRAFAPELKRSRVRDLLASRGSEIIVIRLSQLVCSWWKSLSYKLNLFETFLNGKRLTKPLLSEFQQLIANTFCLSLASRCGNFAASSWTRDNIATMSEAFYCISKTMLFHVERNNKIQNNERVRKSFHSW